MFTYARKGGVRPMPAMCEISGCERRSKARKMCASHLERWRRYGDALHIPSRTAKVNARKSAGEKMCRNCLKTKRFSEFYKDAHRADGHKDNCRECASISIAIWRDGNPDKIRDHQRRRRSRRTDLERERDLAATAEWKRNNPEKVRAANQKRRALRAATAIGRIDLDKLWISCNGVCPDCGAVVARDALWGSSKFASLDHIVPLARGGTHTQENLRYTCLPCNLRKGATVPDWLLDFHGSSVAVRDGFADEPARGINGKGVSA